MTAMASTISLEERRRNLLPNEAAENKEDIQLIWLDDSLDCPHTQSMLLELNSAVQFYSDFNRCINLIKVIKNEQIFLIISNTFARSKLTQVSDHRTVTAIFIFCRNNQREEILINEKVVGIFTDRDDLRKSIQERIDRIEKQTLAFSLFDQKQKLGRDLSKEWASFNWHQMLIYVLKRMPHNQQSKDEMLSVCRDCYRNNEKQLKKIEDFRINYTADKAIEWYTAECFLYKLLNKALRIEDIELIHNFRFFIIDLCAAMVKESVQFKSKNKTVVTTFRGTQISIEDLKKLKENEGKLISINGFFSTSRNINVSLAFAGQTPPVAALQAVLFEIEADPSLKGVIFADIENETQMKGEDEVLFALSVIFETGPVNFDAEHNIWRVKLTATDEGREKIEEHIKSIEQRLDEYPPIIYFGRLLTKEFGQLDRADKYFQTLLKSLPADHTDIAAVYYQIGNIRDRRNDLNIALEYFKLVHEIGQKQSMPNYRQLTGSLSNIGCIHRNQGNFGQALDCFRQALEMQEKHHPGDHVHRAILIQSIGVVHADKNDFNTALFHVFDGLDIFKRILPAEHPYFAQYFGFIGYVYEKKGELDLALDYYHRLLKMAEQCLTLDHPDHWINLEMIVGVYKKQGQIEEALNFCRQKLDDQKSNLGETHPCIARTLISMADMVKYEDLDQALAYCEEALSILEQARSLDHHAITHCLTSIVCLYWRQNMVDDALQNELRVLDLYQQNLSPDHLKIANSLRNIGVYHRCKNNPSEALRYFNESLSIYRVNHKSDHEDVNRIEADIAANETVPRTLFITTINDRQRPYAIPYTTISHNYNL